VTLGGLIELYLGAHAGAQENNTMYTARIHENHLKKSLGADFAVQNLATADQQAHVECRAKAKGRHGKPLSPTTIKKEIASFSGIWPWAVRMGHPNFGLDIPKPPASAHKAQLKAKGRKKEDETRAKRGRKPKAAVEGYLAPPSKVMPTSEGDLLDALKAMKPLIAQYGQEKVREMVDLPG
jgi:hypothetical protein